MAKLDMTKTHRRGEAGSASGDVAGETKVPGRRARLAGELRRLAGTTLFFALAACLIIFTDKLLVSGSTIKTETFAGAIVAGLIIAKVLLVVDMLPYVDAFPGRPLVYNIAWKAPIYVAAFLAFRYLERLIHHLIAGSGLAAASALAAHPFTQPRFWGTGIWMVVLFLVFLTIRELNRALGKNRMRTMFLGR